MADPEALARAINALVLDSSEMNRVVRSIIRAERKLRRAVDDRAWALYMRLEEIVNQRSTVDAELLVSWAFHAGVRAARRARRRR